MRFGVLSGAFQYASLLSFDFVLVELLSHPLVADYRFPTIKPQSVIKKVFVRADFTYNYWFTSNQKVEKLSGFFVSKLFWYSMVVYYSKQLALWQSTYGIELFKMLALPRK